MSFYRRWSLSLLSLVVVSFLCTFALQGEETPVVAAARAAMRNGSPLTSGSPVQPGDALTTADGGTFTLRTDTRRATFGHRTQVRVNADALDLSAGWVQVDGIWSIRDGTHLLQPLSRTTRFEVVQLSAGPGYLHVLSGYVAVHGGDRTQFIGAGEAVRFQQEAGTAAAQTGTAAAQTGSAAGQAAGAGAAGAAAGAAAAGTAVAGAVAGMATVVTVGIVTAAAVAAGFVYHQITTPSSPS